MGYGYRGDQKKIGMNQPIICIVTYVILSRKHNIKNSKQKLKAVIDKASVATRNT
jgi:hypothetical protein